jgi:predicted transcriptional regulator
MKFTIRTDEALRKALTALSKAEDVSEEEIIRRAVLARYEHAVHIQRVTDATQRMLTRWEGVLERLRFT